MTNDTYLMAWGLYLLAVVLVSLAVWLVARRWRPELLSLLQALWLGITLPAVPAYANESWWAPAWVVTLFEGVFTKEGDLWRGLMPVVVATFTLVLLSGLYRVWRVRQTAAAAPVPAKD